MDPETNSQGPLNPNPLAYAREIRRQKKVEKDKLRREKLEKQKEIMKLVSPDELAKHNFSFETHDLIQRKDRIIIRQKKRKTKEMEKLLSRQEILSMIENIPVNVGRFEGVGLMYRALVSLLYLTGARINELLTIKKNQFEFTTDPNSGLQIMVINNVPTLKRGEKHFRPFFLRRDFENEFLKHVMARLAELNSDESLVFPIQSSRAWQIVKQWTGGYNHYFRHVRNTDLVRYYGFSSHFLQQWNGWKDAKSGDFYVNLANQDLKDKVINTNPGRSF